jgi:predicted Zn-dependent peptidase
MANIREDKGYTYGIGSHVVEFERTGYFVIGTEVKKEVREDTLSEIRKEIELLQREPVSEAELNLVRNYMLGQLLKSADGPYAMTDLFLSAELNGKDLEFYNEAIQTIKSITAQRIQELANTYLKWEDLTVISAG